MRNTDGNGLFERCEEAESRPLEQFAREQILMRLQKAVSLAKSEASASEPLREVLRDVLDRLDARELTQLLNKKEAAVWPVSQLNRAAFSAAHGEPATEFLLIPFGEVTVEKPVAGRSFVFTRKHAESARRWFEQIGRKLAIDYEHQSFDRFNTRADGLRPAAGWIGGLEIRADGLWATGVTWTGRARELLRSGEYRYYSPVIFWTDEDHTDVAALGPVALTNDPAMHGVQPLAAARRPLGEALREAFHAREADEEDWGEAEKQDSTEDPRVELVISKHADALESDEPAVPRADLENAQAEIALLKKQLLLQEADTFIERGMRLGKILDSTSMDWRADYLRDPAVAEGRLDRAPVLLPPGRMVARNGRAAPDARDQEAQRRRGAEAEDLAAYERALRAGRVRHTTALK